MRWAIAATVGGAAVWLSAGASKVPAQEPSPAVVIITTGGTIASRTGAATLGGPDLVRAVPQISEYADITVEEFGAMGSSQMTPAHWLSLSNRINGLLTSRSDLAGIVVTHGTDTMEETAFFLNLTIRDARPVVMVGSMRPANAISADGPANLLDAVRVAVTPEATGKGVFIVMNDEISSGRDAWKTDNQRVQTFRAPGVGFLGFVDPDTVVFHRTPTRRHTSQSEFDVTSVSTLPRVELIMDYAGFDGSTIDYRVDQQVDGLVIQSFAGGRMSEGAREGATRAVQRGVPLVIASRVPGGRISGDPPIPGTIVARDLPAHKARILLMLALTRSADRAEIQRMFEEY